MKCGAQRYSKCSHEDCHSKTYSQCNPHLPGSHCITYRLPMRTVYYRPIIPKLLQMYQKSLTKGNHDLLSYDKTRFKREGCITDILDGETIKEGFKSMKNQYRTVKERHDMLHPDEHLYQCSIGFTIFYDGITLFNRKSDSVSPLFVSVVNGNPSTRADLKENLFMAMLHNCKQNTGAERYLVKQMLAVEFQQLETGLVFRIDHPSPLQTTEKNKTVSVYLQARCMFAHLDTIELQKVCQCQGSGSNAGCVSCGICRGRHIYTLKKTTYGGHRGLLGKDHILRRFGQQRTWTKEQIEAFYDGV